MNWKRYKSYAFCIIPLVLIIVATVFSMHKTMKCQKELFTPIEGVDEAASPAPAPVQAPALAPTLAPAPAPAQANHPTGARDIIRQPAPLGNNGPTCIGNCRAPASAELPAVPLSGMNCRTDENQDFGYECQESDRIATITDSNTQFHCGYGTIAGAPFYKCMNLPSACREVPPTAINKIGVDCTVNPDSAYANTVLTVPENAATWTEPVPKKEADILLKDITKGYHKAVFKVNVITEHNENTVTTLSFNRGSTYTFRMVIPPHLLNGQDLDISKKVSHLLSNSPKFDHHDPSVNWTVHEKSSSIMKRNNASILEFSATPSKDGSAWAEVTQFTVLINPKGRESIVIPLNSKTFKGWKKEEGRRNEEGNRAKRTMSIIGELDPNAPISVDNQAIYKIIIPDNIVSSAIVSENAHPTVTFYGAQDSLLDKKTFPNGEWQLIKFEKNEKGGFTISGMLKGLSTFNKVVIKIPV